MQKILVIEDDESLRTLMSRSLRSKGFEVVTARDGGEGIAMWDFERPDLVVTDLYMPNIDGIEAIMARRARQPDRVGSGHGMRTLARLPCSLPRAGSQPQGGCLSRA